MNTREIQLLRRKFIAVAMLSIFMAMLFIGATVNLMTYMISRISIGKTLQDLIASAEEWESREYGFGVTFSDIFAPEYSRNIYFVLEYDADGTLANLYSNSQDGTETELIQSYAPTLMDKHRRNGEYRGYYYRIESREEEGTTIAFLEGSQIISSGLRTMYLTLILGFLGLIITFFLVLHLSKRAIRPEVENSIRQKQFITNASHELKTPLAVIRANTEMLELTQGESEWTTSTLRQIDHLNGLIQNLVMIARSQEQEDRTALSEIDAAKVINESINPYESMAAQSGLTITRDIAEGICITADESKLRQLAAILIDNALKYCDEDGTVHVSLSTLRGGKGIILAVSNHYAAGENTDYSRFFDRFYREDASHNIDKGGYGIGLSIAESICRQYGGSISAAWKDGIITFSCVLK